MTKPKPRPATAAAAVRTALDRERAKRPDGLKAIEIVKTAIGAFQAYINLTDPSPAGAVESDDRAGLRRGKQSSVDRLLFNANYWLAAYEDRIVDACSNPDDARALLSAVSVWTTHTLKLNTLSADEVVATFDRFCPPYAVNNRRGNKAAPDQKPNTPQSGAERNAATELSGKGPVTDFTNLAMRIAERETPDNAAKLRAIADEMRLEAQAYANLNAPSSVDALYCILPAWCLQERIDLVSGLWWNDADVMSLVADELYAQFMREGFGEAPCTYFRDSFAEALDAYQRDISTEPSCMSAMSVPEIMSRIHDIRSSGMDTESDGYGDAFPAWLLDKEQLIWNTVVCAVHGPSIVRPFGSDTRESLSSLAEPVRDDAITKLARTSFDRYRTDRSAADQPPAYESFGEQPSDLRTSGIDFIRSIPDKLRVLGYEVVPLGTCYPEQRVTSFTPSEIECLAILEHRRWLAERTKAGWIFAARKDVERKTSPYLVPWEDLPDIAREWNRSAIRNAPALLATEGLAIAR